MTKRSTSDLSTERRLSNGVAFTSAQFPRFPRPFRVKPLVAIPTEVFRGQSLLSPPAFFVRFGAEAWQNLVILGLRVPDP